MDDEAKKKQPNKPFRQTKQLIKLALNDGWTQLDIGKECRVSQPVISNWKTGIALAKEHQLTTLLDHYGHILRKKTFKVYWVIDENTQESSYVKVEGKVIFSYSLRKIEYSKPGAPVVKIIVHHQGNDKFRLVSQSRSKNRNNENLHCMDEEAKWISSIKDQFTLSGLINLIDVMPKDESFIFLPDAKALPFLIRKALLNHGFTVEDVVEYPAAW